ncbi:chain length determinant protein EpsF [Nitrosomonas sp. PY1]|uniref:chain length determinant protein EpsF n=1 Tax=Nitrosomonas sp. PY1 TaxID=1803906 RepID=UPI001FC7C19F|nr:chain length determinant protein EpsF [Nitrosomonas sp. PY1]GKS69395.1 chain length determinant protein EpsF [Nitrosomonas sp. PY1]
MNYHRFFLILIARWKIMLFTLLVTVMTTLIVSLLLPNNYKSTATVLVTTQSPDPVSGVTIISAPMIASHLATQLDVIRSTQTALMVVDQLKLDQSDIAKFYYQQSESNLDIRNWLANSLIKNLYLDIARDSTVIHINYTSTDAEFAAAVANAFAYAYQEINVRLTAEPSQKAAGYFTAQLNDLRSKAEIAQKKLTQYRDEKGIIDADLRLDVETKRLNDLSTQLVNAESGLIGGNQNDEATSMANNPIITNLKIELSQAESKFSEIAQKYGRNHPSYKSASAEMSKLRSELNNHLKFTNKTSAGLISELRAALEVQRNKVLALNRSRDELLLLTREVESAQQAYNSAMQRLSQTDLEGKSNLSSVSILDTAKVPDKPDSPKVLLNVFVSIFLGTLLGLGVSLIVEMVDQRVRSAEDLVDVFQAPVLGVVQWGKPKQKESKLNSWLSFFQPRNLTSK